jgi:hypothetical protein
MMMKGVGRVGKEDRSKLCCDVSRARSWAFLGSRDISVPRTKRWWQLGYYVNWIHLQNQANFESSYWLILPGK